MAKKKIKFELKQDVLAMCNNKIRKRLFKMPIGVKPKEYFFTGKVDIEVDNPEWDKKAVERSLMLNIKRSMQLLSVRANTLLENLDKEKPAGLKEELKLIDKLKKTLEVYRNEVTDQAEYNLGQIIDDITKDVAKWGKAGDTLNAMKTIDNGKKDLEKTVANLKKALVDATKKIEMHKNKSAPKDLRKKMKEYDKERAKLGRIKKDQKDDYRLQKNELIREKAKLGEDMKALGISGKSGDDDNPGNAKKLKKINERKKELKKNELSYQNKMARFDRDHLIAEREAWDKFKDEEEKLEETTETGIQGVVKEAESNFSSYQKEVGGYCKILQDTAKKMHKMVDSKSKENKAIADLQKMLINKVKPAAVAFKNHLEKCDDKIEDVIKNLKGNNVSENEIKAALPEGKFGGVLVKEFKAVKDHMKREKIQ